MEKVSKYRLSGLLADELLAALGDNRVPPLQIQYDISLMGESGGEKDAHSVLMTLHLTFDGVFANKTLSRNFVIRRHLAERSEDARVSRDRLGTLDLLEEAVKDGLAEMLPNLAAEINQTRVAVYTVNAIGHSDSHLVSVALRFAIAPRLGEKKEAEANPTVAGDEKILSAENLADAGLICVGVDTVRATVECLRIFFNWYLWRLLRRARGRKRRRSA